MNKLQQEIIEQLNVLPKIVPEHEMKLRIDFLKSYVVKTNKKGFILGISGGQDSALAGRICQIAVAELRQETNQDFAFIALRLPYGIQIDEIDAQRVLGFIKPDRVITVSIKAAVDSSIQACFEATGMMLSDYLKGNVKARERMKVHYDIAALYDLLVVGTDHAAEAVTGFFTKYGDGGCDVAPLTGLNKRQGKELLVALGAPAAIYEKVPTADLLDGLPGRPDEEELQVTYGEIDDYLEGKDIRPESASTIERRFISSKHKLATPVTPYDTWWE